MVQVIRNIMTYEICLRAYDEQSIGGTNQACKNISLKYTECEYIL